MDMKNKYYLLLLIASFGFSQTKEQRQAIIKNTDTEALNQLTAQFDAEHLERKIRIDAYLIKHPEKTRTFKEGNVEKEIYDVLPNGDVQYYSTTNFNAARTARADKLYNGGALGLNIQGQDMYAYVWDGGAARVTHQEFPGSKVMVADGTVTLSDHGTHVMGTIVAQGTKAALRGIAFDAYGVSYNWDSDYSEMSAQATYGMLVSNHSYTITPAAATKWIFGAYDNRSRQFDQIANAAPYYLAVAAAGNDRNETADPLIGPYLTEKFGFNLIKGMQNSKNMLTVGAVSQVLTYTGPASVAMSTFSSWGPTDDGRIKPEVVTKGVAVKSPVASSDTADDSYPGTSMASPGVAGVGLLLQQYQYSLFGEYMRAASLKGLIMHSADEAGYDLGPDYSFGWGLVNAQRAATILQSKQAETAIVSELVLNNGGSYTTTLAATGTSPLMVSISWNDPAAIANTSAEIDPTTLYLINDLDIRVTKDGETFYPWTLDPAVPYDPAVRNTDNFRDNFEKIQIDSPNGVYTITVTHKGTTLRGGMQNYTLIASSDNGISLSNEDFVLNETNIFLYPNPANDVLNYSFSTDVALKSVQVTDISGKIIFSNNSDLSSNQINVSDLSSGIYFVTFDSENGAFTKKFIKR